jgi:hypothetical protein
MSGPKVVRVVTREELEAIGRRQIAAVDAAIAQVRRTLRRFDLEEKALEAALASRRQQLETLLERGRFDDLQRQAAAQADYFQGEAARLERKAMAAIEAAKSRRRRVSDAARSLIAALEASGKPPSAELRDVVSKALTADDAALDACQRVLDRALTALSTYAEAAGGVTEGQAELARRLGAGTNATSLAEWLAGQPATADAQTKRLDQVLAELEVRGDASSIEAFGRRAATIAAEASSSQRRLLTDSLILDARAALGRSKAAEALREELHELQGALGAYSTAEARDAAQTIAAALAGPDASLDASLATAARATIEEAQRQLAATARRRVVLAGLATLGYEVRETMATAWARDGRLVVRKPGMTDYGVELAAPADAARLQVRLVGARTPMQPRSAARDRDHEATWCSEFGTLQALLAERGGDLQIERAVEVGAQPVKTVAFEGALHDATDIQTRGPVSRSL